MDKNRFLREYGGPAALTAPGKGSAALDLTAGNVALAEAARELRCETAGNVTARGVDGAWFTWNVVAGERVNVAVDAVAGEGSGTDEGMVVQAIY